MSRIGKRFEQLEQQGRKALILYVVAGDPRVEMTVPLMHALVAAGADILELGVPFSDPMAEGPVIQAGHERALANGVSLARVLEMVAEFRREDQTTPVLLMGYANPVEYMGYGPFADAARHAGVDALLTVDIPPEEVDDLKEELERVGLDNILLVAPTTPDERVAQIAHHASGFIYYVSLKGVTGAGHIDAAEVEKHVLALRKHSDLPIAVGFGIRDAGSARAVAAVADGVVVGSALVDVVARSALAGANGATAIAAAVKLVEEIRLGIDTVAS